MSLLSDSTLPSAIDALATAGCLLRMQLPARVVDPEAHAVELQVSRLSPVDAGLRHLGECNGVREPVGNVLHSPPCRAV